MRPLFAAIASVMLVLLAAAPVNAAVVTTAGSGNWNATSLNAPWPGGSVPPAGSDIVIASGHTVTGNVPISAASMTIQAGGKLSVGVTNITVAGNTSVSGTLEHTSTAGVKTFNGDVVIFGGGAWSETASKAMTFGGNFQNDGTLTANSGVHTFTGAVKSFSGTVAFPNTTVNGTYQNNGTLTVATALAGSGTLTQGPGSALNIGGTSASFILSATGALNTVTYTGGAQTVKPAAYSTLILSGTGSKTIVTATVIVNGTLSMEGTCTASLAPTYGPAATLQYNTATARASGPEWKTPFTSAGGVIITNTGTITLNGDKAFSNSIPLAIRNGAVLNSGNYKLTLGGDFAPAGGFIPGTGTVEWNASGAQSVATGSYFNVILSGSGIKSIAANTAIAGILSIAPTGSTAVAGLEPGLNLPVPGLKLASLSRINGIWGSTGASGASYQTDVFFSPSTGYLTVTADGRTLPLVTAWPVASTLITGQTLSASALTGGSATNAAGAGVAGSFAFTTPSIVPPPGPYSASVTFTPADATSYSNAVGSVAVAVAALNTYYVVPVNPLAAPPYNTWDKAATNIQAAVDQASADLIPGTVECVVLVTNGFYTNSVNATNVVMISTNITLRGVGADQVTISGMNAKRVLAITAPGAVVEGFTLTGGSRPNTQYGAGINMTGGTVQDCIISNNALFVRQGWGSGVYMTGGTLQDCELVANVSSCSDGGALGSAIYASGALIQRCRIHGNTAYATISSSYGAVYLADNTRLRNCLVYGNNSDGYLNPAPDNGTLSAGVYSLGAGNRIDFCTIAGNTMQSGVGAGLVVIRGVVSNTIAYYNHTEFGKDYRLLHSNLFKSTNANALVASSCAYPPVAGVGNISAEPQFADVALGDFRLLPGSPCLDTATPLAAQPADLNGTARTADGNGDGTGAPDMGALEADAADAGAFRCAFVALTNETVGSAAVAFAAYAAGPDTNSLAYAWDFENDGIVDASGGTASHAYDPGFYSVRLIASNATTSVSLMKSNEVRIAPAVIHVATNGAHLFPFATWAAAATNVQSAVDAALVTADAASAVLVSSGVYRLSRQVILDKSISLSGIDGASNTILTAQSVSGRRVLELFAGATNGAVVEGFTLTGGLMPSLSMGAGINMFGGTLRTCIVSNNVVTGRSARGGGVRMAGGVLRSCSITDNRGDAGDGSGTIDAGGGVYADGGLVEACWIRGNRITATTGGAYGGGVYLEGAAILRNCVVASNYVHCTTVTDRRGAGVYLSAAGNRVENCTISENYVLDGNSAGVYLNNGSVTNTIIWRNVLGGTDADNLANHRNYELIKTNMGYCASYPLPPGTNNLAADPLFADRANGDYRLLKGSPAVDAGMPLSAVTNDYDGAFRPTDGDGDKLALTDMGAFERPRLILNSGALLMIR